jgi:hypothetical protein
MNHSSFTVKKSKLIKELKKMTTALGRISKYNKLTILELTITDNLLTLVIPGIKLEIECQTQSTAKATIALYYFKDIIQSIKDLNIKCDIFNDEIKIEGTSFHCQTTFFETDSILRSIKLPINYTDFHVLQLENNGYTIEELRFNKLEFVVYNAIKNLKYNIEDSKKILSVYGVTSNDIEELINKKIKM